MIFFVLILGVYASSFCVETPGLEEDRVRVAKRVLHLLEVLIGSLHLFLHNLFSRQIL
jgi:hypothetical protein